MGGDVWGLYFKLFLGPAYAQPWQLGIWAASATYTTAHGNCQIPDPLSEARDWYPHFPCTTVGTPSSCFSLVLFHCSSIPCLQPPVRTFTSLENSSTLGISAGQFDPSRNPRLGPQPLNQKFWNSKHSQDQKVFGMSEPNKLIWRKTLTCDEALQYLYWSNLGWLAIFFSDEISMCLIKWRCPRPRKDFM